MNRDFFLQMPKVELHVHIEGAIQPETVLNLAKKNKKSLPASNLEELSKWYSFRNFEHFVEVYVAVTKCVVSPEDIETILREFLVNQKAQNILHTEATFTASTLEKHCGIPWDEQKDAIRRAKEFGEKDLGVSLGIILDIVRGDPIERAFQVLEWVKDGKDSGVIALGLAGIEKLGTKQYAAVFEAASQEKIITICHAGETSGPESIWEVIETAKAQRIGHAVRCLEDPLLVKHLVDNQTPLEVSPTSNICIGVFPNIESHPIKKMIDSGLNISINSDDPPMFSTTLTDEWVKVVNQFNLGTDSIKKISRDTISSSLASDKRKSDLMNQFDAFNLAFSDFASG